MEFSQADFDRLLVSEHTRKISEVNYAKDPLDAERKGVLRLPESGENTLTEFQYDQGAYLFLPSYVIRTHGIKQQRETVKRTPRKQLELVFEALDTLGNTKWRINRRILGVVDRLWVNGGRLADLVDREDVHTLAFYSGVLDSLAVEMKASKELSKSYAGIAILWLHLSLNQPYVVYCFFFFFDLFPLINDR
ncbi:hypothetical protein ERO13_A03G081100v2 [Gossypium hirsutum]|uniref:Uncharacterized protein isoform X1 n=1 Tax=Gossypium hirsutum TaxID=3635 RepID=A0ABM3AH31_GOSHI|nr:uncharacterized protein LOC107887426 isoform X1 [Gossypium hirsutum]KAG4207717.1 hypothetical protein ERO13_A03G081100v2 [Gossypium hirsutum]